MANKRVITSAIFEDEFFGQLSMMQRLLWIGLFSRCADDQGRLMDNPVVIRSQVFPYDDIPAKEINEALDLFAAENKIIRYQDDRGRGFIQLVKWWENQNPQWAMPSKYPPPAGWLDRVRSYIKGMYHCENWPQKAGKDTIQPVSPPGQSSLSAQPAGHDPEINPDPDPDPDPEINPEIQEEEREEAGFSRPPAAPISKVYENTEPVRIYREIFGENPNDRQAARMNAAVLTPDVWRDACVHWREHGWKAGNVPGILDLYRKGGAPGCKQCAARDGPAGRNGSAPPADVNVVDAYRNAGYQILS